MTPDTDLCVAGGDAGAPPTTSSYYLLGTESTTGGWSRPVRSYGQSACGRRSGTCSGQRKGGYNTTT